jgi:hypothetical protein
MVVLGKAHQHTDSPDRILLCARGKRPCCRRCAAEKADELTSPHIRPKLRRLHCIDSNEYFDRAQTGHQNHCRSAQPMSLMGLGRVKTKSDLVVMPSGRQIFAFFCSPHDHRAQNSRCGDTARSFYTVRVKSGVLSERRMSAFASSGHAAGKAVCDKRQLQTDARRRRHLNRFLTWYDKEWKIVGGPVQ